MMLTTKMHVCLLCSTTGMLSRAGAALVSRIAAAPACRVASRGFAEKAAPMTAAEKLGESFIQPPIPQFGLAGRCVLPPGVPLRVLSERDDRTLLPASTIAPIALPRRWAPFGVLAAFTGQSRHDAIGAPRAPAPTL